ncbi:hypothetical protein K435DRAFT_864413 [Dendrothele bispora CBS 962.96]|uniref:DUF6699 domain-containing protein n=1 Tax=Dendrothele bispora (strain CBS 962.96) TaxID=1314807 RepID=A0A4S8LMX9_DENBC|nr:hypothetical protein K435DRAFT_864413 [Dendrothele bispora CBS 962.96]
MLASNALAGWTNHDTGGSGAADDFFGAFPGALTPGNNGHATIPSPFQRSEALVWPQSPTFAQNQPPVSAGSLFAQHQDYALHNMGMGRGGGGGVGGGGGYNWNDQPPWENRGQFGPSFPFAQGVAPGAPSFQEPFGNRASYYPDTFGGVGGGVAQGAGVSDANGTWFGKEGQQKLRHLGRSGSLNSPRHLRAGFIDDDYDLDDNDYDDNEWEDSEDEWDYHHQRHDRRGPFRQDETDWDLLDDLGSLSLNHNRHRKRRHRPRSLSLNQPPSSPFYQLSNLSTVSASHKSPSKSNFLSLRNADRVHRPRPLTWRSDYSVHPSLLSKVPQALNALKSPFTAVDGFSDSVRRSLHPFLRYSGMAMMTSLMMDLRINPTKYRAQSVEAKRLNGFLARGHGVPLGMSSMMVHFLNLPNSSTLAKLQFTQPACTPPVNMMRLYHPRLPWYIDVVQTRAGAGGQGVTVGDVIVQVWRSLQAQVGQEEYYCADMDDPGEDPSRSSNRWSYGPYGYGQGQGGVWKKYGSGRSFVGRAWSERCRLMGILDGDEMDWEARAAGHFGRREKAEMAKGVKRVDWLGGEGMVTWVGLVRGKGGVWEMKTQNPV